MKFFHYLLSKYKWVFAYKFRAYFNNLYYVWSLKTTRINTIFRIFSGSRNIPRKYYISLKITLKNLRGSKYFWVMLKSSQDETTEKEQKSIRNIFGLLKKYPENIILPGRLKTPQLKKCKYNFQAIFGLFKYTQKILY